MSDRRVFVIPVIVPRPAASPPRWGLRAGRGSPAQQGSPRSDSSLRIATAPGASSSASLSLACSSSMAVMETSASLNPCLSSHQRRRVQWVQRWWPACTRRPQVSASIGRSTPMHSSLRSSRMRRMYSRLVMRPRIRRSSRRCSGRTHVDERHGASSRGEPDGAGRRRGLAAARVPRAVLSSRRTASSVCCGDGPVGPLECGCRRQGWLGRSTTAITAMCSLRRPSVRPRARGDRSPRCRGGRRMPAARRADVDRPAPPGHACASTCPPAHARPAPFAYCRRRPDPPCGTANPAGRSCPQPWRCVAGAVLTCVAVSLPASRRIAAVAVVTMRTRRASDARRAAPRFSPATRLPLAPARPQQSFALIAKPRTRRLRQHRHRCGQIVTPAKGPPPWTPRSSGRADARRCRDARPGQGRAGRATARPTPPKIIYCTAVAEPVGLLSEPAARADAKAARHGRPTAAPKR